MPLTLCTLGGYVVGTGSSSSIDTGAHITEIDQAELRQAQRKREFFYEILKSGRGKKGKDITYPLMLFSSSIVLLLIRGSAPASFVNFGGCVFHSSWLYGYFIKSITMNPYSGFIDLSTGRTTNIRGGAQ